MEHQLDHLIINLAWTLIHFLWQGLLIGGALQLLLTCMQRRTSEERYGARCLALATLVLAPLLTFVSLQSSGQALDLLPLAKAQTANPALAAGMLDTLSSALPWIVGAWFVGVCLLLLRLVGGCLQVSRMRRRLPGVALTREWQGRFNSLAREFGVRAHARVVHCASISAPTVIGWLKPVVLIPARLFTGFTDEQIVALFAHELAHVARRDYFVNIVQSIVEALLFYHPVVWWVSQGIREEREYCCDDRAVAATHDGLAYARALTALETWRGAQPQLGVSTLGGSLMNRIRRMLGKNADRRPVNRPLQTLATALAVGTLGVSAYGFASLTAPANGDPCACKCHRKVSAPEAPTHLPPANGYYFETQAEAPANRFYFEAEPHESPNDIYLERRAGETGNEFHFDARTPKPSTGIYTSPTGDSRGRVSNHFHRDSAGHAPHSDSPEPEFTHEHGQVPAPHAEHLPRRVQGQRSVGAGSGERLPPRVANPLFGARHPGESSRHAAPQPPPAPQFREWPERKFEGQTDSRFPDPLRQAPRASGEHRAPTTEHERLHFHDHSQPPHPAAPHFPGQDSNRATQELPTPREPFFSARPRVDEPAPSPHEGSLFLGRHGATRGTLLRTDAPPAEPRFEPQPEHHGEPHSEPHPHGQRYFLRAPLPARRPEHGQALRSAAPAPPKAPEHAEHPPVPEPENGPHGEHDPHREHPDHGNSRVIL